MALVDLKFKESDFVGQDISSLPNQVRGQAEFAKGRMDNVAKNMIALGKFNDLIDALVATGSGVDASKLGVEPQEYYGTAADVAAAFPKAGGILSGNMIIQKNIAEITLKTPNGSRVVQILYNATDASDAGFSIVAPGQMTLDAPTVSFNKIGTTTLGANTWLGDSTNQFKILRGTSLRKFKTDIEDVTEDEAETAYGLRARSFKGVNKGQDDFKQYGLVAEEVKETLKALASFSGGKLNGVMYDRLPVLLLKQNQMQKRDIDSLTQENAALKELLVLKGVCTQKEIDNL